MSTPDLNAFRWIVVNSSGGKDSQTALRAVVQACEAAGVSLARVVVSHQCLGRMEWEGTLELVKAQAAHYGLRLEVSKYRDRDGAELSLLDYVRKRGKWPSSQQRFCTSEFKRGPGGRVLTRLAREASGSILNVYGFRADESPARAKKTVFGLNPRFSTAARAVWDWRAAFWREHPQFTPRGDGSQNRQTCDCRATFVDFVDSLQKSGDISDGLADSVTL